ncbi:MAG: hypothetical protein HZLCBSQH_001698 [Candidatus Fervidibacterota bacterium]
MLAKYRLWLIMAIIVLIAGIYYFWVITAPWRIMRKFVYAVEKEDITTIVALAVPEERKYCGVTEQSVKTILSVTLGKWRPFKAVRIGKVSWEVVPLYKELGWHRWFVVWGEAVTGKPIPFHSTGRGYPPYGIHMPQLFTEVTVCPTDEGYRVVVTEFLIQLSYGVHGSKYLALLHHAGIKGQVTALTKPGEFEPFVYPKTKMRRGGNDQP